MSIYPAAQFLFSAAAPSQFPSDDGAEVAIAGRSNAGKSTAINAMMARRALARTSKTPGRTRLLNFFQVEPARRLVDLPGYGYAQGAPPDRDAWARLIDALGERQSLRGLFLVVDARRGLMDGDEQLLNWAASLGKRVHVLLSKSDQLKRAAANKLMKATQTRLQGIASAQLFSAHAHAGLDEARLQLNDWLADSAPEVSAPAPVDAA
jgi:GTP-binding protein